MGERFIKPNIKLLNPDYIKIYVDIGRNTGRYEQTQ